MPASINCLTMLTWKVFVMTVCKLSSVSQRKLETYMPKLRNKPKRRKKRLRK